MFKRKKQSNQRRLLKSRYDELIVEHNPKSPAAEAYRALRTNISFLSPDKPLKSISITSSGAGEGKSLTIANLAVAVAQQNKRVIVIDADMRKPMQHKFYDLPNIDGLSNILSGEIDFETGLSTTKIDNLKVITSGSVPPNPVELLASTKMSEIIVAAQKEADMVLVDAPPIIAVTDAAVLADKVDGVLLVVASHQTQREMLAKAKENLERANANVIGTVMTKCPVEGRGSYYGYNNYYYGGSVGSCEL